MRTKVGPKKECGRLSHAARLQVEHPEMPIGEVIADSGFGSRTTYYKVRKQLEER